MDHVSNTNIIGRTAASEVLYEYTDYGETEITGNKDFYNEICYTGGIYDASTGIMDFMKYLPDAILNNRAVVYVFGVPYILLAESAIEFPLCDLDF